MKPIRKIRATVPQDHLTASVAQGTLGRLDEASEGFACSRSALVDYVLNGFLDTLEGMTSEDRSKMSSLAQKGALGIKVAEVKNA